MSDLVLGDTGALAFLLARLNNVFPTNKDLTIKLYTNDKTPTDGDVTANYTEASGGGYAAKTLTAGNWTGSIVGGISQAVYEEQIWTFTGALDGSAPVYGYEIVDSDGVHLWAQKFNAPVTPVAAGNHIDVVPVMKLSKGTPS